MYHLKNMYFWKCSILKTCISGSVPSSKIFLEVYHLKKTSLDWHKICLCWKNYQKKKKLCLCNSGVWNSSLSRHHINSVGWKTNISMVNETFTNSSHSYCNMSWKNNTVGNTGQVEVGHQVWDSWVWDPKLRNSKNIYVIKINKGTETK